MKHAILLLWHKNIKQLLELIDCFDDDFYFYIHIDKKNRESIEDLKKKNNVYIYKKYKVYWGGINILKSELFLLEKILKDSKIKKYEYVHFFSGQDYPIKELQYIKKFFETNKGKEFVHYMKVPSPVWENNTYERYLYYRLYDFFDYRTRSGRRKVNSIIQFQKKHRLTRAEPKYFAQLYGGSNWMSITLNCAEYIISNKKKHKCFYNRLKYTFAPEETYFQTIILNSHFASHVENWNLRYIVWNGGGSPRILTIKDWYYLQTTKDLFARKFEATESKAVINLINKYLIKKTGIKEKNNKEVVLLVAHVLNKTLVYKYFQLKEQIQEADVILLLNNEDEPIDMTMLNGIDCRFFDMDMLNELHYVPIEETLIPGSNHFALLWFFLHNPRYEYYWNIEYDVDFTGNWNLLFKSFQNESTDFISTQIYSYEENPNWYWWESYHAITLDIPLNQRIHSFNPIYRISQAALEFLDFFLKKGNSGHHEVLIPTALFHSGFKIMDFGGNGSFVLSKNKERFYLNSTTIPELVYGTMAAKPHLSSISSFNIPNKLFHPVKNDIFSAGLKVLTIIVTYNGLDVIDKCLKSLQKSLYTTTILVIDNNSSDGTIKFIKTNYPEVIVVENIVTINSVQAKNKGLEYALANNFDYILMINQDICIKYDTILNLLQAQNQCPEYALLIPMHYFKKDELNYNFLQDLKSKCPEYIKHIVLHKKELRKIYTSDYINADVKLLDVNCIKRIGELNSIFKQQGEDEDYYNRIIYNGFKVGIVPNSIIYTTRVSKENLSEGNNIYFKSCEFWKVALLNPHYNIQLNQVYKILFKECIFHLIFGENKKLKEKLHTIYKLYKDRKLIRLK